jgi:hypothetical protein
MPRDLLKIAAYRFAEFLREAAVLVAVFSLLERIIAGELTATWLILTLLTSVYLFAVGVLIEWQADRVFGGRKVDFDAPESSVQKREME